MGRYDDIALVCVTDKSSDRSIDGHGYMDYFEEHLRGHDPRRILEIGVGGGGSLKMWETIFPHALIVGVDIHPGCLAEAGRSRVVELINARDLRPLVRKYGSFDFIVDDGSHIAEEIFLALDVLWDALTPGGLYAIEDMYCDLFDDMPKCTRGELLVAKDQWPGFCGDLVDWVLARDDVAAMTVHRCQLTAPNSDGQCIIFLEKKL